MKNEFFGSKLNTVLLFVLIILMVIAIRMMLQNKELYFNLQPIEISKIDPVNPEINIKVNPAPDSNIPPYCKEGNLWGNKEDLISFLGEINSNTFTFTGSVKNSYFFEGNILVNVSSGDGKIVKNGHGTASSEWMTSDSVSFSGSIDITGLPKGYDIIEIKNDNPSGLAKYDKSIFIRFLR
jgi:hypothetical protein